MRWILATAIVMIATIGDAARLLAQQDSQQDAQREDHYVTQLSVYGIRPDAVSIAGYLRSLRSSEDQKRRAAALITRLGDGLYAQREAAHRQLVLMADVPLEMLAEAAKTNDPEIRWRSRQIFKVASRDRSRVLHAALRTLHRHRLTGAAADVLAAIPQLASFGASTAPGAKDQDAAASEREYLLSDARLALQATVTEKDVALLRETLTSENAETRVAATGAIAAVLGKNAADDMRRLLGDADDRVRMESARALANVGARESLSVLGELLDSDRIRVRRLAVQVLRASTGRNFEFTPYEADATKRKAKALVWQQWIKQTGATAKLVYPLPTARFQVGRILVCSYRKGKVLEYDEQGKEVWSKVMPNPWGCHGLPNGHRLISSYTQRYLVEFDEAGKEVWRMNNLPGMPFSCRRLENGNTLVSCYNINQVLEINRAKEIVWRINTGRSPCDARRMPNGNTMVSLLSDRKVVEYDRKGNTVWSVGGLMNPRSAQPLENGNVLVCDYSRRRVIEFARDGKTGKEVWSSDGNGIALSSPYNAQRLDNGDTLVVDNNGLHRITRDRKMTSIVKGTQMGFSNVSKY